MSGGASSAALSHASTCMKSVVPAPAAAREMLRTAEQPAMPTLPGHTRRLGQGRAHLGIPFGGTQPSRGMASRVGSLAEGTTTACPGGTRHASTDPKSVHAGGLHTTAGVRWWDTSAKPPGAAVGRVGPCHGGPCHGHGCGAVVATAVREDLLPSRGIASGWLSGWQWATAGSAAVTPWPLCGDLPGLSPRGAPCLGKTRLAPPVHNTPSANMR